MGSDTIWVLIPMTALLIPIVVVFTKHQQKMAELIHANPQALQQGQAAEQSQKEIQNLRQDLTRLQNVVSTLAINVENLKDEIRSNGVIQDRISIGE